MGNGEWLMDNSEFASGIIWRRTPKTAPEPLLASWFSDHLLRDKF
jgi:hypothetical protein